VSIEVPLRERNDGDDPARGGEADREDRDVAARSCHGDYEEGRSESSDRERQRQPQRYERRVTRKRGNTIVE
jgi:hypothetical protein